MAWVFMQPDNSWVIIDDATTMQWDAGNNRPMDWGGEARRIWEAAGSPTPEPYPSS